MIDDAEAANSKKRSDHIGLVSRPEDDENEGDRDDDNDRYNSMGAQAAADSSKRKDNNDIFSAAR